MAGISNDDLWWFHRGGETLFMGHFTKTSDMYQSVIENEIVTDRPLLTKPGGLLKLSLGKGQILVDQIRWQTPAGEIASQADRIASLIATNMGLQRTP